MRTTTATPIPSVLADGLPRLLLGEDGARFNAAAFPETAPMTFVAAMWTGHRSGFGSSTWSLLTAAGKNFCVFLNPRRDAVFTPVRPDSALVGTFVPPALPSIPAGARRLAATDLDGDGDGDLLVTGAFGLRVLRNDRLSDSSTSPHAPTWARSVHPGKRPSPTSTATVGRTSCGSTTTDSWEPSFTRVRDRSVSPSTP
jgi:hypothetical protein